MVTISPPALRLSEHVEDVWKWDGSYTERWEQGFRKRLYHGRTGSYWKSEYNKKFEDWTKPEILTGVNTLQPSPWNNALRMRNSQDGSTVDELYIGFPKAHHRAVFCFDAYLPSATKIGQYIGFEVNSGGQYAGIIALGCELTNGQWRLKAINPYAQSGKNVSLNNPDAWDRYALVLDPPYLELYESPAGNPGTFPLELVGELDLKVDIQGKFIPFIANEASEVCEFRIGNIWIYEILPRPIYKTLSASNPTSNPSLLVNVDGRQHVEIWAKSISAGTTVLVQGGQNDSDLDDIEELTTAALNGVNQVHKGYLNAMRYIKVTIEETGTGTEEIKVYASRY